MKTHPGRDKGQPCIHEHQYYCADCGNDFETEEITHWRHPLSGKTFVTLYWPACSFMCYSHSVDFDPSVLDEALRREDTTLTELNFLFDYVPVTDFIEPDLGDI